MTTSKAVREAKARLAEHEAQRAAWQAEVDAARKPQLAAAAKTMAVQKRRNKARIVSNTGGAIWIGAAGMFSVEHYGLAALAKATKPAKFGAALGDALEKGTVKVNGQGGVGITLRGLAGRVRTPDKAHLAAYDRAVRLRTAAAKRFAEARTAEDNALRAVFDTAVKIPTADILPGLIEYGQASAAEVRLRDGSDSEAAQRLRDTNPAWIGSPIQIAKAHLEHLLSEDPDKGDCPCHECAHVRQQAIRVRDLNTRLNGLPRVLADCPVEGHGRHRVSIENATLKGALDARTRDQWTAKATEKGLTRVLAWLDTDASRAYEITVPRGWCRKGEPRPLVLLAEFEKQLGRRPRKVVADVAAASV